jgi:hypothetical protein
MEADLQALGARYMDEPAVAPQLLEALLRIDDADAIDQAWLNCNWADFRAINLLVEIHGCWNRHPTPLGDFMQACWGRNDTAWHYFVDIDVLDHDPALARLIYQRFAHEGPTDQVLETMGGLRNSLESDHYADLIMPDLINQGMRENPARGDLLRLWRRYGPVNGVAQAAIGALKLLLVLGAVDSAKPCLHVDLPKEAVRVVECLPRSQLPSLLPALVRLASSCSSASRRARRMLVVVSDTHLGVLIAHALPGVPWHAYMARFHRRTLWHMLDYMLEQREVPTMQALWNTYMGIGLDVGLFTRLVCLGVQVETPCALAGDAPAGVHAAIYYMHVRGVPPPDISMFHWAQREWPAALQVLSRHPAICRELNWARRRGLLMPLVRATGAATGTATGTLGRLHTCEAIWPVVMGFL